MIRNTSDKARHRFISRHIILKGSPSIDKNDATSQAEPSFSISSLNASSLRTPSDAYSSNADNDSASTTPGNDTQRSQCIIKPDKKQHSIGSPPVVKHTF
jgi:hypothetical protein